MKGSDLELGQRIWEDCGNGNTYSAGRVISISESIESDSIVYALLKSDDGEYTIYTFEKNCNCGPRVSRKIPGNNFIDLISVLVDGIELPEEKPVKKEIHITKVDSMPLPADDASGQVTEKSLINAVDDLDDDTDEIVQSDCEDDESSVIIGFDVTMSVV
jgi:hypothetical protein